MTLRENRNGEGKWILHVDGSSNFKGSGLGLVLTSSSRDKIEQSVRYGFQVTNNKVEYKALIAGLGLAQEMRIRRIKVLRDSQLVVNQMNGAYQARDLKMSTYLKKKIKKK